MIRKFGIYPQQDFRLLTIHGLTYRTNTGGKELAKENEIRD